MMRNTHKLIFVAMVTILSLSEAIPQGYGSSGQQQQQKCREIKVVEYEEQYETVCNTVYRTKCEKKYEQYCRPERLQECGTSYEQRCETKQEKRCGTKYRNEPYTDKECKDEYVEKCEKHWQQDGYGSKVWVDDPSTCQKLKETVCEEVQRSRRVPYEHCDYVPKEECSRHPVEKCEYVSKQKCEQRAVDDCSKVPEEKCEEKHKKVPVQRVKRVCEGDPEWNTSTSSSTTSQGSSSSQLSSEVLRQGITEVDNDRVVFGK